MQMVFATDLQSRSFLQLPRPVGVDFRASYVPHSWCHSFDYISLIGSVAQVLFRCPASSLRSAKYIFATQTTSVWSSIACTMVKWNILLLRIAPVACRHLWFACYLIGAFFFSFWSIKEEPSGRSWIDDVADGRWKGRSVDGICTRIRWVPLWSGRCWILSR